MDHEQIKECLMLYDDGELSGPEAREIASHLSTCADCRTAYDAWRNTARAFFRGPQAAPSKRFVREVMARLEPVDTRPPGKRPLLVRWLTPAIAVSFVVGLIIWPRPEPGAPPVSIEGLLLTNGRDGHPSEWILREEGPAPEELLALALEGP